MLWSEFKSSRSLSAVAFAPGPEVTWKIRRVFGTAGLEDKGG
jgi:hypothetical protein